MNSCELTAAITALSNGLAACLSPSELALVASLFVQLGDTLATIGAAKALLLERDEEKKE